MWRLCTLRAALRQVRSSSLFPILLLLAAFLFTTAAQALFCPCLCLAARSGAEDRKAAYRCQGSLQREGEALAVIGSQDQHGEQGHFICRCWGGRGGEGGGGGCKVVEGGRGGQGVFARVKHCGENLGSYPIELLLSSLLPVSVSCSPLCPEAFLGFACSIVARASQISIWKVLWLGELEPRCLNLQHISNSWGVRGPVWGGIACGSDTFFFEYFQT